MKKCKCEAIHEYGHEKDCPTNKRNKEIEYIKELIGNYKDNTNYYNQNMRYINEIGHTIIDMEEENKRKTKTISDLNDTLEITVIAEMLDLIKNGKPIPPTRKQLQSKLDKIEEVYNNFEYDEDTKAYVLVNKIEQILGDE